MNHYDNPQCTSVAEFEDDMKRFLYLKKLLSRYKNNRELRERLILNHIIVTAHKNNTYDYYSSYYSGVQIECEIIGNTPCNSILKVN